VPAWEADPASFYASCGVGPAFYPEIRRGRPIYLSGVECPPLRELEEAGFDVGIMAQPASGIDRHSDRYRVWAADNGCFTQGETFDPLAWFAWLGQLAGPRARFGNWGFETESRRMADGPETPEPIGCLFATAPDVVGDAVGTWERSLPWFAQVRSLGLPVALVGQNGLEDFAPAWDECDRWDCLFIGGDDAWKLSDDARECVRTAQQLGKWVHMGRVNSLKRLSVAAAWHVDSVDGTYLGFGPRKNAPNLRAWLVDVGGRLFA
jgi:hypothetical protein